ncbi:MAG: zinc carboxypeptidase [Bdellovibrionaceae bacterium]|nr:zinc carboxypeptidase [Pseudobdellovibrionaceae bacterium]|tara:strand:- start:1164 stop:2192 length:1029 start_codon:yes stop_codon:yes gene_type:complete
MAGVRSILRGDVFQIQDLVLEKYARIAEIKILRNISHKGEVFPIHQVSLGNPDKSAPTLAFVGGVHGLERIGSEVVLSWMQTLSELYEWDEMFQERLKHSRLIFVPILNPVGVANFYRSNGRGVDLMRNGRTEGKPPGGVIYRGHRWSRRIPWFRGEPDVYEEETQALFEMVQEELFPSKFSIAMDVHSGFGAKDRIWFPFGHSHEPYPDLPLAFRLKLLLDQTYPHHFYDMEPVSTQYTIHGDLWDDLYFASQKHEGVFMPFTLEMGSWNWLKKNPLQIFNKMGVFHPLKPHRHHRILRRHITFFDFLHRALLSQNHWWPKDEKEILQLERKAKDLWYKGH